MGRLDKTESKLDESMVAVNKAIRENKEQFEEFRTQYRAEATELEERMDKKIKAIQEQFAQLSTGPSGSGSSEAPVPRCYL